MLAAPGWPLFTEGLEWLGRNMAPEASLHRLVVQLVEDVLSKFLDPAVHDA